MNAALSLSVVLDCGVFMVIILKIQIRKHYKQLRLNYYIGIGEMGPKMRSQMIEADDARLASLSVTLRGDPGVPDSFFLALFNGAILLEDKWQDNLTLEMETMPLNLKDKTYHTIVASNPLLFLFRVPSGKPTKQDPDPLLHTDNRAGGTVDLLPLVLGEEEVYTTVHLISLTTAELNGLDVIVRIKSPGKTEEKFIPIVITMISAHCLPTVKEGTCYMCAIGLTNVHEPHNIQFNQSLSDPAATNVVWASVSNAGFGANTAYSVPQTDKFVPEDLDIRTQPHCRSCYWNAVNRVLVDRDAFVERLSTPFLIDVAGTVRGGKFELRGRYMGWVDACGLLIQGQMGVTVCAKLIPYNDIQAATGGGALLSIPPTSAKGTAREIEKVNDESGHSSYIVIRFDVFEPIIPRIQLDTLYENLGFPPPVGPGWAINDLDIEPKPYDPFVDVSIIRKECGALKVHKELSNLSCQGGVPMPQGIKRLAAHTLLARVRTMLNNFSPGDCSFLDWQDTVTGQHSASRRAVTASFAPQPPRLRMPDRFAACRARIAGDNRLSDKYIKMTLQVAPSNPRSLLSKILRCLEERNDLDAKNYLLEALSIQTRSRFLLWILGAQEFDKGEDGQTVARNAFRIANKGDYSEGTVIAIGYAAFHAFYHANGNAYGAHNSARKMRKYYALPREWEKILNIWFQNSGEEEVFWSPSVISSENPMLISAAFFLCLRCYKFSETLLQCVENNCFTIGTDLKELPPTSDVYYLRAASYILRRQFDLAMEVIQDGIKKFGPSASMSQIRLTCLSCTHKWNPECELAFKEAERAGWSPLPSMLFKGALNRFKIAPKQALQRAALVHKMAPSGHTALLLGRVYDKLGESRLAERWCAVAVKVEPLLADGWAMLTILSMYQGDLVKARMTFRTAKQVGSISPDIEEELNKVKEIVHLDAIPDMLVKNLCIENKYDSST